MKGSGWECMIVGVKELREVEEEVGLDGVGMVEVKKLKMKGEG